MERLVAGPCRNPWIEGLRVLSICGVIAFHARVPGMELAYAGLVAFVILAPYVDCHYNEHRQRSLASLAKAFLVPWLFWMIAYGALNLLGHRPLFPGAGGPVASVLAGTRIHLWFLPFMFVVIAALNALKRFGLRRVAAVPALALACLALVSFPLWHDQIDEAIAPYRQWLHAMPAVFVGIALGLLPPEAGRRRLWIALILLSLIPPVVANLGGVSTPYGVGVALVLLAISLKPPRDFSGRVLREISSCTLGVYLVHMAFLRSSEVLFGKGSYLSAISAAIASFLIVWSLRKFVPRSRLVLG